MAARRTRQQRALDFRQCAFCAFDLATGEGERACHYYDCPYLPDELDVRCPTCRYNSYTGDGNPACGDDLDCDFLRNVAPERVRTLNAWLEAGSAPSP